MGADSSKKDKGTNAVFYIGAPDSQFYAALAGAVPILRHNRKPPANVGGFRDLNCLPEKEVKQKKCLNRSPCPDIFRE